MKHIYLICNAHLDPVWMWEKDEGIAEVLSTFRVAADFCEQYPDFIFNHNESVLYEWVEEYDPALFARIQKLVTDGRWNIIGGFYLQPDCNMPSGEAMVRQALVGRYYFYDKFGAVPRVAINFDSFGHTRGLVQILQKSGYEAYMVCRPTQENCPLPADDFRWKGYDGSEVLCHRGFNSYESHRGKADLKIQGYLDAHPDKEPGLVLWGIGNHGGGPSRVDYERISALGNRLNDTYAFCHSTPEAYFQALLETVGRETLPVVEKSLHYHSVGCYTSQVRVKQTYRRMESMLFKVEKMMSAAALNGLCEYPQEEFEQAQKDMLFTQFHDILPGSSIASAEKAALRQLDHGIEILERLKIKAFLLLQRSQQRAADGVIPVFVYNPHPVPVRTTIECEFNLPDQNTDATKWSFPQVYQDGRPIACQVEHEESNFNVDWRKRIVFTAELAPSAMNRFECRVELLEQEPPRALRAENGVIAFRTDELAVDINCATGAIDRYAVHGVDMLKPGALTPLVMDDDYDSWGNTRKQFDKQSGEFALMCPETGTAFSGIESGTVESVRVIEDGQIRSIVEAVLQYGRSNLTIRYTLPKTGTELGVSVRVNWAENMKALKLRIPTTLHNSRYIGQVMYGRDELPSDGMEVVSQRYSAVISDVDDLAVSIITDGTYGSDCRNGEARMTLLRSPGYSAGCSDFSRRKPLVMEQDRCNQFIDQGIREFRLWLNAGPAAQRLERVETEAIVHHETPFALSCFPDRQQPADSIRPLVELDDSVVQMTAFKRFYRGEDYLIRLFEPTGTARSCTVALPCRGVSAHVDLQPFEIVSLRYSVTDNTITRTELLEQTF